MDSTYGPMQRGSKAPEHVYLAQACWPRHSYVVSLRSAFRSRVALVIDSEHCRGDAGSGALFANVEGDVAGATKSETGMERVSDTGSVVFGCCSMRHGLERRLSGVGTVGGRRVGVGETQATAYESRFSQFER